MKKTLNKQYLLCTSDIYKLRKPGKKGMGKMSLLDPISLPPITMLREM